MEKLFLWLQVMNNKLKNILLFSTISLSLCFQSFAADIDMNTARIQAMDKITGRVSELDVPVNGLSNFGTFSILIRRCVSKSPEETPENTAFVDVVDNYQTSNPVNVFKGWMFSSTPALNAVEHPIYDIWLLNCYNRPQNNDKLLTKEQLDLRDTIPMVRPKKIQQNIHLTITENIDEEVIEKTLESNEQNIENQVININITENANGDMKNNTIVEEEFASEGEEIISDSIAENDIAEPNEQTNEYEVITITE